jgi:hypothetical protein
VPAYPGERQIAITIAGSEVATAPAFHLLAKEAPHQARQTVDVRVASRFEASVPAGGVGRLRPWRSTDPTVSSEDEEIHDVAAV